MRKLGGLDTDDGGGWFCWDEAAAGGHTAGDLALPDTIDSQDGARCRALIFLADCNLAAVLAIRFLLELEAAGPAGRRRRSQESHHQRDADDEEDERLVKWWRH